MTQTIFITGCGTGIGRMTAKFFHDKGWNVVATVRSNPQHDTELNAFENMLVVALDVTQADTITAAVDAALDRFGAIDVLLNNAGYGSYGVLEATPEDKIRQQFDVNVIGTLMMIKAVLPPMRARKAGTIINISSMGGKITFPLGTLYHGSKFAVEGMTEALSFELAAIGIQIKMVEPGMINTNFSETVGSMLDIDPAQTEYAPFIEKVMTGMAQAGSNHSEPKMVSEVIWQAATDGSDQLRYIAGADAEQILSARKSMDDPEYLAMIRENMGL